MKLLLAQENKACMRRDYMGRVPIDYAATSGKYEACNVLVDKHATLNAKDRYGASLLPFAVRCGYLRMVEELLAMPEIDINSPDSLGRTTFWWAQKQGYVDIVSRLENHTQRTGVVAPPVKLDHGQQASFEIGTAYCDVCIASVSEDYYYCKSCGLGDFYICLECLGLGAHYLVESHNLFRHKKDE